MWSLKVIIPIKFVFPPTIRFFSIPTPPSTIKAPVSLLFACVVILILTSAPVKVSWSVPFSSYSIFESLPVPKVKKVSSGITISPDPFGSIFISPFVFVEENVLPSRVKLSTFH